MKIIAKEYEFTHDYLIYREKVVVESVESKEWAKELVNTWNDLYYHKEYDTSLVVVDNDYEIPMSEIVEDFNE